MYAKLFYIIPIILASWIAIYASFGEPTLEELIKRQNELIEKTNTQKNEDFRRELLDCIESQTWTNTALLEQFSACSNRQKPQLQEYVGRDRDSGSGNEINTKKGKLAPTPSEPPSRKWYTKKHTLILKGSHDYRQYAYLHPWVAWWRNNNPSGLTWWVSHALKWLWDTAEIDYERGTARPKVEKWHYILFGSVEHGIRAKMISIRERWWNATVSRFLSGWWTDYISLSFDKSKLIKELSEEEFMELFINQLKKESPWYISQLVKDWILVIE